MNTDIKERKQLDEEDNTEKSQSVTFDDFESELQDDNANFEALERDIQEVLTEMSGDGLMEKFRLQYEKLHRALKKSHDQEKRLVKKCKELNIEIVNNQTKIKTALRLSQEDQKTITHLQKEMEKTWKLVYMSQDKESRSKETIAQLKDEMNNLSKLVERGAGLSLTQENAMKDLRQAKEELQRNVDELNSTIHVLKSQLNEQFNQIEKHKLSNQELSEQLKESQGKLSVKELELTRELKRREKIQKELQETKSEIESAHHRESDLHENIAQKKATELELQKQISTVKLEVDKSLREHDQLQKKTQKITEDLETQIFKNKTLHDENLELQKSYKSLQIENRELKTRNDILERSVEKEKREVLHKQKLLDDSKLPLQIANNEIENLKSQLNSAKYKEVQLVMEAQTVSREKDLQIKSKQKIEQRIKQQEDLQSEQQRIFKSINDDLTESRHEISKLKTLIAHLENDRDRLARENREQTSKYSSSVEETRVRDVQISELKKKVGEYEQKFKQQQQLYEAVRADRNHYSKALIESQTENSDYKNQIKTLNQQIDHTKNEITLKDDALVKLHFENQKNEKLKEIIQHEVNSKNQLIKSNADAIRDLEFEIKRINSVVKQMDEESMFQRKQYDAVINERDVLGIQLIRRNDELSLLYEKLRIQSTTLKVGEMQYNARVDDIRLLRMKIKELIRNNLSIQDNHQQVDTMRNELVRLQKDLILEKSRVTALSEELENPINVHRWRKLEGSDPATFEMIQKIQTLQRRLIIKTEEVVEKDLLVTEKNKLIDELKAILSRQPGPELTEQLSLTQQTLRKKDKQIMAMASELNLFQAQSKEYLYEIEKLQREIQLLKKKYYKDKRKLKSEESKVVGEVSQNSWERSNVTNLLKQEQIVSAKDSRVLYAGGGFAMRNNV